MTEAERWTWADPSALICDRAARLLIPMSERKVRLLACALCRRMWSSLSPRLHKMVETAERFADGEATRGELLAGRSLSAPHPSSSSYAAWIATWDPRSIAGSPPECASAFTKAVLRFPFVRTAQAALLRDVIHDPFRGQPVIDQAWLLWQSGTVSKLALSVYRDRTYPRGTFEPHGLCVLADALEDAGCTDPAILGQLRGEGLHVRGWWLLDLLLRRN
jgi:hypothetical protein